MIKNNQKEVNGETGDCLRASMSSLLEYPLEAVPNFVLIPPYLRMSAIHGFLWSQGYALGDNMRPIGRCIGEGIDGHFMASVPSRSIQGESHAVVINPEGWVVHDPNPNKKWIGVNVFDNDILHYVYNISRRIDEDWTKFLEGGSVLPSIPKRKTLAADILYNSLEAVLKMNNKSGCEVALLILNDYFKR